MNHYHFIISLSFSALECDQSARLQVMLISIYDLNRLEKNPAIFTGKISVSYLMTEY